MKNITNLQSQARILKRQLISYEIFPPKGDMPRDTARDIVNSLSDLGPDFISVTFSAGGSGNSQATSEVVQMIQDEFDIPTMAHLTCYDANKETIEARIADYKSRGINNVLALRGDPIPGVVPQDFLYAKDLIEILADEGFCVGAAAYPEGHIDCFDADVNVRHLAEKQAAGANFFITQLFFDNDLFYRFWDKALNAGISIPIEVGIMPFLSKSQITRMVFTCGASLPSTIVKLLSKYEHDEVALRQAGIEYACEQLIDLSDHGVDGLHIYVMNQPDVAKAATEALRNHWDA